MSAPRILIATLLCLFVAVFAVAEEATATPPGPEMRSYYLAFVLDNPDFEEEEWVGDALEDHRDDRLKTAGETYLHGLIAGEAAVVAGSLEGSGPIRQIAVLDVDTAQEAAFVFENSPGIQSGRQEIEIYPWWVPAGILKRAKDPRDLTAVYLGLLKRPAQAPDYTAEQLEEMQRGHLENLRRLTESGDLVIAGPVEHGGELRGLMIFRGQDERRIRELVAADPAVQARRLELELYRWHVPKRSWPLRTPEQKTAAGR